jgi:hypothetical protein
MRWNRARFHLIAFARTGDACCKGHHALESPPAVLPYAARHGARRARRKLWGLLPTGTGVNGGRRAHRCCQRANDVA